MKNVEAEEEMKQVKPVKRVIKEKKGEKNTDCHHPMLWGVTHLKDYEDCIGFE
jgi:hypothetical protein